MSKDPQERPGRIKVWVQRFPDRANLMLQWHDPVTGSRKSKSAGTADEDQAELKRQEHEVDLNRGDYREPSRVTWEAFREVFEDEHLPNLRENTRRNYRVALDHVERIIKPKRLESLDGRALSRLSSTLRKPPEDGKGCGMKASSIELTMISLQAALRWAKSQGLLAEVPAFPKVKVPERKPQPVDSADVDKLLDACGDDAQMRTFLLTAWLCGLRLREAYNLRWAGSDDHPWVNFQTRRIILPAPAVKGVTDQWVPLDPALADALNALPRQPGSDHVFRFTVQKKHEGPLDPADLSARVIALAASVGLAMSFKTLRRGFGCRYAGKVPAQVLQKLMRHSDIKITMAYYANVDDAVMRAVLGDPLPPNGEQRNTSRNSCGQTGASDDSNDGASGRMTTG